MTFSNVNALELLGKQVSFNYLLGDLIFSKKGIVTSLVFSLSGSPEVLLDDGKLVLEVVSTDRQREVRLKIIFGGVLSSKKGVNLPDTALSIPCITEKDLADLDFILTQPVNWIALSFVRRAEDIMELQELIDAAVQHAVAVHKHSDTPDLRAQIRTAVREGAPPA